MLESATNGTNMLGIKHFMHLRTEFLYPWETIRRFLKLVFVAYGKADFAFILIYNIEGEDLPHYSSGNVLHCVWKHLLLSKSIQLLTYFLLMPPENAWEGNRNAGHAPMMSCVLARLPDAEVPNGHVLWHPCIHHAWDKSHIRTYKVSLAAEILDDQVSSLPFGETVTSLIYTVV